MLQGFVTAKADWGSNWAKCEGTLLHYQLNNARDHISDEDGKDDDEEVDDNVHLSCLDVPDSDHVPANCLVDQDCIRPT